MAAMASGNWVIRTPGATGEPGPILAHVNIQARKKNVPLVLIASGSQALATAGVVLPVAAQVGLVRNLDHYILHGYTPQATEVVFQLTTGKKLVGYIKLNTAVGVSGVGTVTVSGFRALATANVLAANSRFWVTAVGW